MVGAIDRDERSRGPIWHDEANEEERVLTEQGSAAGARIVVSNRYEVDIDHPIGQGGMAIVYRGWDLRAKREVALKTLRPEYQRNPESRRRFRQEARMMAFVSHPRVVTIYDINEDKGSSWVIMEYVPGRDLKEVVKEDGPKTPEEILPILREIAEALGHLHERDLVHLDIKPQNIRLMPDGHIKLIDFGLAQPAGPSQQLIGGTMFGTAAYLAPEQAAGEPVDAATDVYALGCVVYELLTGRPPFVVEESGDQHRELIHAHLELLPIAPSEARPDLDIPSWVDDVIGWALAKKRNERFHDVATFARMFQEGIDGDTVDLDHMTAELANEDGFIPSSNGSRRWPADSTSMLPTDVEERRPRGPSSWRRMYVAIGRGLRHTRRLRFLLWRLTFILFMGNLILGVALLARGGPSALVERFLAVAPGTTTEVTVEDLNLRDNPTLTAAVIDTLPVGADVTVTGLSISNDGYQFWPVEVQLAGRTVSGWVWDGGLAPNEWTGRLSWVQRVVDRSTGMYDSVTSWTDSVFGLWPFTVDLGVIRNTFSKDLHGFVKV